MKLELIQRIVDLAGAVIGLVWAISAAVVVVTLTVTHSAMPDWLFQAFALPGIAIAIMSRRSE